MPIFRKKIKRESEVTVAIEADNLQEADDLFNGWIDDPCSYNQDDLNITLGEKEKEKEEWIAGYETMEEYARKCDKCDDFMIANPDSKEPKFDLYITYKDDPGKRTAFLECNMTKVLSELDKINGKFMLQAHIGCPSVECITEAKKHDAAIIWFEAERRK